MTPCSLSVVSLLDRQVTRLDISVKGYSRLEGENRVSSVEPLLIPDMCVP